MNSHTISRQRAAIGQTSQGVARQSGASLIEVLVAILLVSVGLLGVAGLSGATFAYNKNAQIRLVGMGLVNDYADRARVNVYGFDRNKYSIVLGTTASDTEVTFDTNDANQTVAETAADKVALYDQRDFLLAIANWLPQGTAVVESNPTGTSRSMDIWLLWKEPQDEDDDLFKAGQENCPALDDANKAVYSCMYFKVGL